MNRRLVKPPVSVLTSGNKQNNLLTPEVCESCGDSLLSVVGGEGVNNPEVVHIRKQLERLFTTCSPLDSKTVHEYLRNPTSEASMMLDAWAKCGCADRGRTIRLDLSEAARRTVTPFGIACLVTYARAWIDQAEAMALGSPSPGAVTSSPQDAPARSRPQGPKRTPQRPATAKRSRKG